MIFFAGEMLAWMVRPPFRPELVLFQMASIGVGSVFIVSTTGFFTGMVLALQTNYAMSQLGAEGYVGGSVAIALTRELGPVLTALMLTGRVGSGIAAELGSMMVTDQINALRALGTDPILKLVVPRVFAGFVMTPILTVISDFIGIAGGWVVARFTLQVSTSLYWSSVTKALYMADVWMGILKPIVFGFIIVTVACHVGLRTAGGTAGVGRSTTLSVVAGSVAVIAADFFVSQLLLSVLY